MLNRLGEELDRVTPVTLPRLDLADVDVELEAREAAARIAERKVIRAGLDAWAAIGRAESFETWRAIGAALVVGKAHALRVTGANRAAGKNYCRAFSDWMKQHRFGHMPKSTRSVAIELSENVEAIKQWRATLPELQRKRLRHPLSNVRAWRRATTPKETCLDDRVKAAGAAWRRFVACVEALPADQAAPFWQVAHAQGAAFIGEAAP